MKCDIKRVFFLFLYEVCSKDVYNKKKKIAENYFFLMLSVMENTVSEYIAKCIKNI